MKRRRLNAEERLSKLQQKFQEKLEGGQFRWINEQLYTTTSKDAGEMLKQDPSLFEVYHEGFRRQVSKWPVNPVERMIEWLKRKDSKQVVVDFGCGDAAISKAVDGIHKVHSFDLVAANDRVVACDMANVPLKDGTADVAIFCLSLMGTNIESFLREAKRVLKPDGTLLIAEVRSRFEEEDEDPVFLTRWGVAPKGWRPDLGDKDLAPPESVRRNMKNKKEGKQPKGQKRKAPEAQETKDDKSREEASQGVRRFISGVCDLGFRLVKKDESNQMFVFLEFKVGKSKKQQKKQDPGLADLTLKEKLALRACKYKKR